MSKQLQKYINTHKIWSNEDVKQQTTGLAINLIKVYNFAALFTYTTVCRTADSMVDQP